MKTRPSLSRRRFLQGSSAGVLVATGLSSRLARAAAAPARPNFVFIMADDLGYADLSCYGRRDYQTPRIDSLARDGLLLTDGYANSAVCSATRFALLSGRYQYRFPGGLNEPLNDGSDLGFPTDHPTIASLLRAAGYGTVLIGKWHLGALPNYGPLKCGYDRFYGLYSSHVDYYTHEDEVPPDGVSEMFEDETTIETQGYVTDLFGDRAVDEIEGFAASGRPFLVSLHFNAPHWPWMGPDAEGRDLSANLRNMQHFDGGNLRTYAAMMRSLDDNVGKVLDALDRTGQRENTIVVFTSDNGGERFSDNWPFSGMKTELLEGGIRVPTLVRWPARIRAGSRSSQQAMSMDWLPTFVAAAGGQTSADHPPDGIDLLPVLTGERPAQARKLFWRYNSQDQEAARDGRWKYLKINGHEFLFDVEADPLERGNLKEREPAVFARLKADFAAWNRDMLPYDEEKGFSYSLNGGPGRLAEKSFR